MNGSLIENTEIVSDMPSMEVIDGLRTNRDILSYEEEIVQLVISRAGLKKIEAAAFYNDYENTADYLRDIIFGEIEADKQRHLKGKEFKETNKLKK